MINLYKGAAAKVVVITQRKAVELSQNAL